ncbi:MAG: glycosyltransferase [Patescibacteria group bacterium]|jgi:glycosyltransferase involved in cell wall biosynthesis
MSQQKISIIVPVYNEEKYLLQFIKALLTKVKNIPSIKKIVFIDDGSQDSTGKILSAFKKNPLIKIIKHQKNQGKGAALRSGVNAVKDKNFDAFIFIDGDNQHDPIHLPDFIDSLKNNQIVFGYRKLGKKIPFIRKLGNNIARFIFRNFFHIHRKDLLCGYMAFRKEILPQLQWRSDDYGVETELSAIVGLKKLPFKEIKVNTIYLDTKKGVNLFDASLIFSKIPYWYLRYDRSKIYFLFSFISILVIYFLLSFKAPFSTRTLIPNLEPYPDSLYYATPAWNFIHGKGFNMLFGTYFVKQVVPPLYSLLLLPFFAVFRDVRSFYFANLLLMFGSIFFLTLIIKKLFGNKITDFIALIFLLFLFVSNFYIYMLPAYLLAENITIFFVIFSFYLLSSDVTKTKSLLSGGIGILFWFVKFSNLPLGFIFYFLYLLKILSKNNRKYFVYFFSSLITFGSIFLVYALTSQIFAGHKNLQSNASFSIKYFQPNVKFYLENLLGKNARFLWFEEKMLSPLVSLLAISGVITGLFSKKSRLLLFYILSFFFALIGFMCFFYSQDTRFIIALYPLIIILIGIFFQPLVKKFSPIFLVSFLIVILIGLLFVKGFNQRKDERMIMTFKKQVGLNFKYREDPWYYMAIQDFNNFFANEDGKKIYLGTFLPPFLVNFYTNGYYHYLPLTLGQDFFPEKDGLAEKMKVKSIQEYYRQLLLDGNKIYITNIYSNNLRQWREDFDLLLTQFNYKLVRRGCLETCNLFELTLK